VKAFSFAFDFDALGCDILSACVVLLPTGSNEHVVLKFTLFVAAIRGYMLV
jgi:hypothetical protein